MKKFKKKNMNPVELNFRETMWKLPIASIVMACEVLQRIDKTGETKQPNKLNFKNSLGEIVRIDFTFIGAETKEEIKNGDISNEPTT